MTCVLGNIFDRDSCSHAWFRRSHSEREPESLRPWPARLEKQTRRSNAKDTSLAYRRNGCPASLRFKLKRVNPGGRRARRSGSSRPGRTSPAPEGRRQGERNSFVTPQSREPTTLHPRQKTEGCKRKARCQSLIARWPSWSLTHRAPARRPHGERRGRLTRARSTPPASAPGPRANQDR
jgi:hypothetical protein